MVFRPPSEVGGPIGSIQENRAERDPKQWVNKLCGCSCGCSTCLFGCFCAPCAAARARSRFDGSAMCFNICFLNLCIARNYIRRGYGIKGHYCDDCWASICCGPCVACQLLGETEERGSVVERWALNPHRTVSEQPWKFGLCSCTEDLPNCAYGCCCWPCAVGSVRYALDGSDCLFNCCMLNAPMARSMVRKAYNIQVQSDQTRQSDALGLFWLSLLSFQRVDQYAVSFWLSACASLRYDLSCCASLP
ncbi:unnamed protein product [Phaeothamnion confervicola]